MSEPMANYERGMMKDGLIDMYMYTWWPLLTILLENTHTNTHTLWTNTHCV